jgi:hypothetical protein
MFVTFYNAIDWRSSSKWPHISCRNSWTGLQISANRDHLFWRAKVDVDLPECRLNSIFTITFLLLERHELRDHFLSRVLLDFGRFKWLHIFRCQIFLPEGWCLVLYVSGLVLVFAAEVKWWCRKLLILVRICVAVYKDKSVVIRWLDLSMCFLVLLTWTVVIILFCDDILVFDLLGCLRKSLLVCWRR